MALTAKTFLARYAGSDYVVREENTGLTLNERNRDAPFVQDLSSLPDIDFAAVTDRMSPEAIRSYLYNKHPDFFSTLDQGRRITSRMMQGQLDGKLDMLEIGAAGGMDRLLTEFHQSIADSRDRCLLSKIQWLSNPEQNRIFVDALLKQLRGDPRLPPEPFPVSQDLPPTAEEFLKKFGSCWRIGQRPEFDDSSELLRSSFVRALNNLSDPEFELATGQMPRDGKKLFLYNKYPEFFQRWDNGYQFTEKKRPYTDPKKMLDGRIEDDELHHASEMMPIETLYKQAKREMFSRDMKLLIGCKLIVTEELQIRMVRLWLHDEHESAIRALFGDAVPGTISRTYEKEGVPPGPANRRPKNLCVHDFQMVRPDKKVSVGCVFSMQSETMFQPKVEWSRLEYQARIIQKFWLRMVLQHRELAEEEELRVGIDSLDDRYAIHTNNPDAAKTFLIHPDVLAELEKVQRFVTRMEIRSGVMTWVLDPVVGDGMSPRVVITIADSMLRMVQLYESGGTMRVIAKSSSMCPYCREPLQVAAEKTVACSECSTLLHMACWIENRQCTTWGCASTKTSPGTGASGKPA